MSEPAGSGRIVAPQLLDRIQTINVGDLKLELREIRYHQQLQREELDRIRLALRLAVSEGEFNLREFADLTDTGRDYLRSISD